MKQLSTGGIETLSLRALARELGVSHAAPLRHFSTKADLLQALAMDGVTQMIGSTAAATEELCGLERLRRMAEGYVEWARNNPAYHMVLRNPDVMRHASDALRQTLEDFARVQRKEIEVAQAQGWRSEERPQVLFVHLVALMAGSAIVATDPIYKAPVAQLLQPGDIDASLELFLRMPED